MIYEYEPIKDLEKEIEYVRWNHEKTTHAHEKMVIGTQLRKLESRLHKFKQAAKADEYEAKAEAFDRIVKESKGTFSCGDFFDDVRHIINSYEIGVKADDQIRERRG